MSKASRLVPVLAALAIVAAGCIAPAGGGGTSAPTSGLVVRIAYANGFVPVMFQHLALPIISIYGDGRVIAQGAQIESYPGPLLPAVVEYQLPDGAIERILADAEDAGLTDEDVHYPATMVADAPDTVITVRTDGRTVVSSFNALGADEGATPDEKAERLKALEFVETVGVADMSYGPAVGGTAGFEPDAIRLFVQDGAPLNEDPALTQQPAAWPLATPLASFGENVEDYGITPVRCAVVSGDDLSTLWPALRSANQLTPWQSEGEAYTLYVRPLLPDEPATCD